MNPGNQLGVWILTPTDNAGRRAFQIRDFDVVVLFDTQCVELLWRQKFHQLAVTRYFFGEYRVKMDVWSQKLFIDATTEQYCHRNIKF